MPRRPHARRLVGLAAAGLALAACTSAAAPGPVAGNATFAGAPRQVASAGVAQWPLPDHDYDNTRDAGASPIDAASVARLTTAWTVPMTAGLTTAPIIMGNRIYAEDNDGEVVAVDRSTGGVVWRSQPLGLSIGPNGVAVGYGKVFAATGVGIDALDARDGSVAWTRRLITTSSQGVDMQPTVVGGRVLIATVPGSIGGFYQGGARGWLFSLDASTGATAWTFDTVASPTLWGNPTVNSGGGAWYPPAVDVAANRVYWGIANPAPFVGTAQFPNGTSRPGANLYTDSTVALNLRTGHLVWYHQVVPHDIFDRDFVHAMIVAVPGATPGQVVVGAGKSGEVFGFDPTSGHLLWRRPIGMHRNGDLPALEGPTEVLPGTYGGVLTPPASADGVVYAATLNAPDTLYPDQTAYFGGKLGTYPGDVAAIDGKSGRLRWQTEVPGDPTGAVTVVNDLVLTATDQGMLIALNRTTGKIVSEITLPGPVNGWLSVAGSLIVVPVSGSHPPELLALHLPAPG